MIIGGGIGRNGEINGGNIGMSKMIMMEVRIMI